MLLVRHPSQNGPHIVRMTMAGFSWRTAPRRVDEIPKLETYAYDTRLLKHVKTCIYAFPTDLCDSGPPLEHCFKDVRHLKRVRLGYL